MCPFTGEWLKKTVCICIYMMEYIMEYMLYIYVYIYIYTHTHDGILLNHNKIKSYHLGKHEWTQRVLR